MATTERTNTSKVFRKEMSQNKMSQNEKKKDGFSGYSTANLLMLVKIYESARNIGTVGR